MKYIGSLKEGMRVSDIYLCKMRQILTTKTGKEYASVVLQDKTGSIDAKIWDLASPGIEDFDVLDYVRVDGDVTSFNRNLQLNIKRVRIAASGDYLPSDYLPMSKYDIKLMYKNLCNKIDEVKNSHLQILLKSIFIEDREFAKSFCLSSAAKSVHHSFVGGLIEHSLSVANLCEYYCGKYPILNRDLLISAALLHDIGKTEELSSFPENDYTDSGQLLGHIVIGLDIISEKIRAIEDFPTNLSQELRHCIVAHHGELEYGSPKKPALIEALALNLADNTDAKMQTFTEILESAKANTDWLGYNRLFESNLRRTTRYT